MLWERKLEQWAASVLDKLALPLRVVLWNGQHFNLSHLHPEMIIRVSHVSDPTCFFTPHYLILVRLMLTEKIKLMSASLLRIGTVYSCLASCCIMKSGCTSQSHLHHNNVTTNSFTVKNRGSICLLIKAMRKLLLVRTLN